MNLYECDIHMYKIKEQPEDFIVKEVMDLKIKDQGPYAYFLLKKKNWTTLKAVEAVAEQLQIDKKRFATAGMKDKYGITEQYVGIKNFNLIKLKDVKLKDVEIKPLGYGNKRIGVGSQSSNHFIITVRNLDYALPTQSFIANYYDDQRFGEIRPNTHLVGKAFLKRNYEEAMKIYLGKPFLTETPDHRAWREQIEKHWGEFPTDVARGMYHERRVLKILHYHPKAYVDAFRSLPKQLLTLFIQAYQSKLFNDILNSYIKKRYKEKLPIHTVVDDYTIPKILYEEDKELELPMPGYTGYVKNPDIEEEIQKLMKQERMRATRFRFRGFPEISSKSLMRKAFVPIKNLTIGPLENDELHDKKYKQVLSFKVQKGSYATMVIKQLYARSQNVQ
ncbi:MAG: tRNA pseudouridine(13) synthase TruD [Nanoarchaeota archaeon]|nr:tRNA pseudouridine(13) synthase TruD [Nanoarchaeota archaeon]